MLQLLLIISFFSPSLQNATTASQDIKSFSEASLHIIVDETGTISIGRDTVSSDALARYIQERLFKKFMGTGRMYKRIIFSKANNKVPKEITNVVLTEIKLGQQRALTELCLQKYNNKYENISTRQKAKLKKHFPVLFQTKYTRTNNNE